MSGFKQRYPQDLVAIFHASFHPTKGNLIDWSLKANDGLSLDNLEFNALPSGLHLVEQDVVYFTKDNQHGVCVFKRRNTTEQGHRGARLSSLGILLANSPRPKPWRHLAALKDLIDTIYSRLELSDTLDPTEEDWQPARDFFEQRKIKRSDLGGAGDWLGWSPELDGNTETDQSHLDPILHLPHLLRILGPNSLTLHKYVISRKRILIYTLPPVEAACILCQVAADICYEDQVENTTPGVGARLKGKCKEGINVLGMVTLIDVDRMRREGQTGRGWIACTTDAIFLEKPSHYDLLIDLTTSTPNKATRPSFYASQPVSQPSSSQTHRLSLIRFAWSDVKLWNELNRILTLDTSCCSSDTSCCTPGGFPTTEPAKSKLITAWTDVWRVYEDVCVICAGLWMGAWRGNSTMSYSTANGPENWGSVRSDGDDDLTLNGVLSGSSGSGSPGHVRNLGMGIEGRPLTTKPMRHASTMSWSSRATLSNGDARRSKTPTSASAEPAELELDESVRRDRQLLTTLALLQTFHKHTHFQLTTLHSFLPSPPDRSTALITLTGKEVLTFELGVFSWLDVKYLEWLTQEYGEGAQVVVKRRWKDLFGLVFGYG